MYYYKFSFLWLFLLLTISVNGQVTISVGGNTNFPNNSIVVSEAGLDYPGSLTSTQGPTVNISHQSNMARRDGQFNWRVMVNKSDFLWSPLLELTIRRTGDGQEGSRFNNWISGGTNFVTVSNMPVIFFEGGAVRRNVPLEFRINNISVLVPADNFETTVIFTIYEM